MTHIRFWPAHEVMRVVGEQKLTLRAFGAFMLGYNLERLEVALSSFNDPVQLAEYIEPLRACQNVLRFEDIGRDAVYWHDLLSNLGAQRLNATDMNDLRAVCTKWEALVQERLETCYLITPATTLNPKQLMAGAEAILDDTGNSKLVDLERSDIRETCRRLLIGSVTAAEYMALRAEESLLRRWYQKETDKTIKRATWGRVLDKLVKEYPEAPRPKEISSLGYLKLRRDEVAHPERVSTLIEAETTLMNVYTLSVGVGQVLTGLASQSEPDSNEE